MTVLANDTADRGALTDITSLERSVAMLSAAHNVRDPFTVQHQQLRIPAKVPSHSG